MDIETQLQAMRQGITWRHPVKINGFTFTLRPISIAEQQHATDLAMDKYRRLPEVSRHRVTESSIMSKEILKLASTSDWGQQDGILTDDLMDRWTPAELQYVYSEWLAVTDKVNPALERISLDTLNDLIDDLKKKPKAELLSALTDCSLSQLREVASYFLTQGE